MPHNLLRVQLMSPEGVEYEGEAESVLVTTEAGQVEIFPGHTNFVSPIAYSKTLIKNGQTAQEFYVRHGLVTVDQFANTVSIMGFACQKVSDIRYESLLEYHATVLEQLQSRESLSALQVQFLEDQATSVEQLVEVVRPVEKE